MFIVLLCIIKGIQIWYKCLLNGEPLSYKTLMKCNTDLNKNVVKSAMKSGVCLGHNIISIKIASC